MTKKTLVQEVLDLPELQQYYHTDQLPERRPLRLVCTDTACKETPLEKFGEPVEVLSQIPDGNQPYLAITQIEHNGTSAHIEFTYPPEGVAGTVVLKMKDEAWQVTESDVFEN